MSLTCLSFGVAALKGFVANDTIVPPILGSIALRNSLLAMSPLDIWRNTEKA